MKRILVSTLLFLCLAVVFSAHAAPIPIMDVVASGDDGNVPENTLDGLLTTRWSAHGDGQWIRFELEMCDTVSAVKIAWYKGDSRVASFDIEVSDGPDGPWTVVHSGDSAGNTLELETIDIDDSPACFVRIVGHGNTANEWNSVTEFQIEGTDASLTTHLPVCAVTASSEELPTNVAANAIDGDLNTRWSARGMGEWIEFDLCEGETAPTFNEVSIAWFGGDTRSATFQIEVSADGEAFTKIYSGYSSGTTAELQPYGFAPVAARYVRIVGFGNSRNDARGEWNSISEVTLIHATD